MCYKQLRLNSVEWEADGASEYCEQFGTGLEVCSAL